jgi:WD40 repeat protein
VRLFTGHKTDVIRVRVSACGRLVASGGVDGRVLVHDMSTGRALINYASVLPTHAVGRMGKSAGAIHALAFTRDSHTLAIGYHNSLIRFLNLDGVTQGAHDVDFQPK